MSDSLPQQESSPTKQWLTKEEYDFCTAMGFTVGYDRDVPNQHQYLHLCWPYELFWGAVCGSDKVWGQHSGMGDASVDCWIDCATCYAQLTRIRAMDPVLLAAIGGLARKLRLLVDIEAAMEDYLYVSLHPERAIPLHTTPEAELERLNKAMLAREEDWSLTVQAKGNCPLLTPDGWKLPESRT